MPGSIGEPPTHSPIPTQAYVSLPPPLASPRNPFALVRISLNLSVVCLAANIGIIIYATLWLPLVAKVTIPIDVYNPRIIPLSTAIGLSCVVLLMLAFWPIWGLLTPLLVMFLLFGFLFSAHFVPCPSI